MLNIGKYRISVFVLMLFLVDIICYCVSVLVAEFWYIYYLSNIIHHISLNSLSYLAMGAIYLIVFFVGGLYEYERNFCSFTEVSRVLLSCLIGTVSVVLFYYFPFGYQVGRTILLVQGLTFSLLIVSERFIFSLIAMPHRLGKRVLIVGAGNSGRRILRLIRAHERGGVFPVGFVDDDLQKIGTEVEGLPVMGDSGKLPDLVREHNVALAVMAITHKKSVKLMNSLIKLSWSGCQVMTMPTLFEFLTGKLPTSHISEEWFFQWNLDRTKIYAGWVKRLVDLFWALLSLMLSWPLFMLAILLIKLDSPGPIFFRQQRLGKEGKVFNILKFRTMIYDAENVGPGYTIAKDPRITRVGRLLRKYRLDELPQLLNVLKGEMSFIGPRPLVPYIFEKEIPFYNYRLLVKPGITGWAQVMYPDGIAIEFTAEKLKYDLYYVKNIGALLDLNIILKTIYIVLLGRGI
jgi:exopolysaccharide biosynthesis polyprenyl glycosylphosphotransferase